MDDVRNKTPEERLAYFQEKLAELIKKTDIEPVPQLITSVAAVVAVVTLIDIQNPAVLKKYGLKRNAPTKDSSPDTIAN